jgi:anti-sigma regulatory factor (Ser/Thr protein kinase)
VNNGSTEALGVAPQQLAITLSDISQVGEARRAAARAGHRVGMAESDCAKVSIVASELAGNIVRHAGGGELLVRAPAGSSGKGVELIALDRGPGIADPARCMTDGYSTAGSLGHGLGAIRRLSNHMDIYSQSGHGTAIYSRIEATERAAPGRTEEPARCAISVAVAGETECGDNWRVAQSDTFISAVVADGLGHGPLAAKAANEAMRVFDQSPFLAPVNYLTTAHEALRNTRGAALACARVDLGSRTLLYAGVGNVAGSVVAHDTQREKALASHNGIIGHQMGNVKQFQYPVVEEDLLVMHSDGLTPRWKLESYPGLSRRTPALIAAVLYRDFKRGRDDATVLVVRLK